jgi:hypothetical protein
MNSELRPETRKKKDTMARPQKKETAKRYTVRLLSDQRARIEELADLAGLTTSEYIRRSALGKRIRSKVSLKAMNELRRLGGLQKLCLTTTHDPENRQEMNRVLNLILVTIKQLQNGGDDLC